MFYLLTVYATSGNKDFIHSIIHFTSSISSNVTHDLGPPDMRCIKEEPRKMNQTWSAVSEGYTIQVRNIP